MHQRTRMLILTITTTLVASCATPIERTGQQLFAGCIGQVDDRATSETGRFVCEGDRDPAPFAGNGRSCGDCHVPADNFGLSIETIESLDRNHPLFYAGLDEDPSLLRRHGLIHVLVPGQLDEFRQSPTLVRLQKLCDEDGNCDALGLNADRVSNLCAFTIQAVSNHMAKSTARVPGQDFRPLTDDDCEALIAYMLSDLVAGQNERAR